MLRGPGSLLRPLILGQTMRLWGLVLWPDKAVVLGVSRATLASAQVHMVNAQGQAHSGAQPFEAPRPSDFCPHLCTGSACDPASGTAQDPDLTPLQAAPARGLPWPCVLRGGVRHPDPQAHGADETR